MKQTVMRDAWMIVKKDFRNEKFIIVWSVIFMLYTGGAIGSLMETKLGNQELGQFFNPFIDIMMLSLIPMLGFYFSRKSFKYLTEDSYTQMLAYFRTLPIAPNVTMRARHLQMGFAVMLNSVIFFSILYFISNHIRLQLSILPYIAFSLTWIGYAVAVMGIYIHFESLHSGKKYFWKTLMLMLITIIVSLGLHFLDVNVLQLTIDHAKMYGFKSPVMWISLIGGVVSLVLCGKLTLHKLQMRDLV
ncbi:hypothetical protein J2T13_001499 [Paenibacillus sp. DS2015]|uniref:hypothetical protein n=1 Tax=Paenibacillus sp. DS2015 TaxID=3373917 RepID=UPI003D1BA70E